MKETMRRVMRSGLLCVFLDTTL